MTITLSDPPATIRTVTVAHYDLDDLVTTGIGAAIAGVTAQTIGHWARRGYTNRLGARERLTQAGINELGQAVYRVADILRAEACTRRSGRGRPRTVAPHGRIRR